MFFTRIGQIIAWLLLTLGTLRCGLGFLGAFGSETSEDMRLFAKSYLAAETTGEAINEGMMKILIAVCLGILVEISRNIARDE